MRNLVILTTARSDYYLLKPLIYKLKKSKKIDIKIITTGSHLIKGQGFTYKEVEKDFGLTKKVKFSNIKATGDIAKAISPVSKELNKIFKKLDPDGIIILGDRYEAFITAVSAFFMKIPIIHIHGGEISYGSMDDTMRHVITKLSTYTTW